MSQQDARDQKSKLRPAFKPKLVFSLVSRTLNKAVNPAIAASMVGGSLTHSSCLFDHIMSTLLKQLPTSTRRLLQHRTHSVSRPVIMDTKEDKDWKQFPQRVNVTISELYRSRLEFHHEDRLFPPKVRILKPENVIQKWIGTKNQASNSMRGPFSELTCFIIVITSSVNTFQTAPRFGPDQDLNNKIFLHQGDITKLDVGAIVNAANRSLLGGGGVDGRIHDVAGEELLKKCKTLNGCKTGSAKITDAYKLPCRKIIHAVGPVYHSGDKEESERLLASCYTTSLTIAARENLKSIAFSCISTGVYGYPSMKAACVALSTVRKFLQSSEGHKIDQVIFCLFLRKDVNAYLDYIPYVYT